MTAKYPIRSLQPITYAQARGGSGRPKKREPSGRLQRKWRTGAYHRKVSKKCGGEGLVDHYKTVKKCIDCGKPLDETEVRAGMHRGAIHCRCWQSECPSVLRRGAWVGGRGRKK